jgi:alkylhydroperoxidase/carboxymuconolactone decarboxylase family protein YurZ
METTLIRTAAALCSGDEDLVRQCFNRALDAGATPEKLREVIHTAYLFDGYPTALEGFRLLGELTGAPKSDPAEFRYDTERVAMWRERGDRLCRVIYGAQYARLMKRVREFAPELADAMLVEGYGKVLSRENLDPAIRELCVVAILAAKYRPRQLLSHCLGALRLGVTPTRLTKLASILTGIAPSDNLKKSQRIIQEAAAASMPNGH